MKTGIWILIGSLFPFWAFAQKDSIYIEEIEINATSLKSSSDSQDQTWNAVYLNKSLSTNLSTFLSTNSSVFIKNYGPNTLATSSLSGGNASQTNIYWNGLAINNPMLGLLDLALLPINTMESISVSSNGNSALWGNGNIGGGIFLQNSFAQERFQIKSSYNSINQFYNYLSSNNQYGKVRSSSKIEYTTGKNNYRYRLLDGEERKLKNADVDQLQFMQSLYFPINSKNQLSAHAWLTRAIRGIPPTTRQLTSSDTTRDTNQRYSIQVRTLISSDKTLKTTLGYFIDNNTYNSQYDITTNKVKTFTINSTYDGRLHKSIRYLIGINNRYVSAKTPAYQRTITQNQVALFSSFQYIKGSFTVKGNIRQELIGDYFTPIAPSLYILYRPFYSTIITGGIARNYRYPALNDLFWKPGGNPDLKAENGWNYSLKIDHNHQVKQWKYKVSGQLYSRIVDDWIMWARQANTPFFAAYNIAKVWSRGFQANAMISHAWNKQRITIETSYKYTLATSQREIILPKIAKGDQLWYTPISQFYGAFNFSTKFISCGYRYNYVGKTEGIQEKIPSYGIHNLVFSTSNLFKKNNIHISIELNNLLNTSYRVIEYRPMPDRNLTIGIQYKIH